MIIDYQKNKKHASRFIAIDPATRKEITPPYVYADDVLGITRHYGRNGAGQIERVTMPSGELGVIEYETRRKVKIIPRPGPRTVFTP